MHYLYVLSVVLLINLSKPGQAAENEQNGYVLVARRTGETAFYCFSGLTPDANQTFDLSAVWNFPPTEMGRPAIFLKNTDTNPVTTLSPGTLVLAPENTQFKDRLIDLSQKHPQVVFGQLANSDFDRLVTMSTSAKLLLHLQLDQASYVMGHSVQVFIFVYCCAFGSILLGSIMICLTREEILLRFRELIEQSKRSKWACFLGMGLLLAMLVSTLLVYYFFYDIAVYAGIALCCLLGVLAVTDVVSFWIMHFCACSRISVPLNFRVCGRTVNSSLYVTKLCVFPLAITLISTWLAFRKDPDIGWPMQTVIGVLTVSWILKNSGLSFLSLKMITLFFALITLYDIFFVFITPLFHHSSSVSPTSSPVETSLTRQARSVDPPESVMEAVATGSAGRSGELLPISFRFQLAFKSGLHGCSRTIYRSLLGYGDAVIPGVLSGYLMLFDSFWQIRFRRNFVTSLLGYILGLVATHIALNLMKTAQPALLYLCPCTLGLVVLSSVLFGGLDELRRLWIGTLPAMLSPSPSPLPEASEQKQEFDLMDGTGLAAGDDGSMRSGTLASLVTQA